MSAPRLLVFRNGQIGNTLAAVPVLRALRRRWPEASIDVVVDALSDEVLRRCPYVNERIVYERRARDPGWANHLRLLGRLRRGRYDAALICKRFLRNELLAWTAGAARRIGFETPGRRSFRLTDTVPYREDVSMVDQLLRFLEPLGVSPAGRELEAWWSPEDEARFATLARESGLDAAAPFVVLHTVGETQRERLVPAPVFADVARSLAARGIGTVALFGPRERDAALALRALLPPASLVLVGEPLAVATAAIARSRLFIGHDSGPSHLAAATKVPGFVIYDDGEGWEDHLAKWKPPGDTVTPVRRSRATAELAALVSASPRLAP